MCGPLCILGLLVLAGLFHRRVRFGCATYRWTVGDPYGFRACIFYLSGEYKKYALVGDPVPAEGPRNPWKYQPIYKLSLASDKDHFAALSDMTKELEE